MSDSIVLVCAILASLAAGVMVAYTICLGMFATLRPQRRPVVAETIAMVAGSTSAVEG